MKRSRFTEYQIIGILKEHEAGISLANLFRKHGVRDATIYKWQAKYGGMDVSEAKRDAAPRERLKELAKARRRFGYRRLHVFLRREGHEANHKRLFSIYQEEQLPVCNRGGRKRAMGTRARMALPLLPNQRWSLDFVSDQRTDGSRFRILTVVDDCTREYLALIADTSLPGARATLFARAKPQMIVSDNILAWEQNAA